MMKIEERAEKQEDVKFHFQAPPPQASSNFSKEFSPSTINLFPEPKNLIFKFSVQRRWVYSVAEASS